MRQTNKELPLFVLNLNFVELIHGPNTYFEILFLHIHGDNSHPSDNYGVFQSKTVAVFLIPFINHV